MNFKKPQLEDKVILDKYFNENEHRNCELTFANTYLWSRYYNIEYTILDDLLIFKSVSDQPNFIYPIGNKDKKAVILKLIDYCRELKVPFVMRSVNALMFEEIEETFPNRFKIEYIRDVADYLYQTEDLMKLSGKKYHGKKNHINKFRATYNWSYERIDDSNIEDCILMAKEWSTIHHSEEDIDRQAEMEVTYDALKNYNYLGLSGGLIRVDDKVVAFSIGEPVGHDCFVIHIEKAYASIQGAYPMINQQMILDYGKDYQYINREEDMGVEGLRKAKLSYKPVMLLEKGYVVEINNEFNMNQ